MAGAVTRFYPKNLPLKTEMDEEAKRAMFPGNYRAQAGA